MYILAAKYFNMKKMLLASVVIAGMAMFTSCTKDYTCTCTSVSPDGTVTNTTRETISGTKGGAQKKCKQRDNVVNTTTTTCLID